MQEQKDLLIQSIAKVIITSDNLKSEQAFYIDLINKVVAEKVIIESKLEGVELKFKNKEIDQMHREKETKALLGEKYDLLVNLYQQIFAYCLKLIEINTNISKIGNDAKNVIVGVFESVQTFLDIKGREVDENFAKAEGKLAEIEKLAFTKKGNLEELEIKIGQALETLSGIEKQVLKAQGQLEIAIQNRFDEESKAKNAIALFAREGELKTSVEKLTVEFDTLSKDIKTLKVNQKERREFDIAKVGLLTKEAELNQRMDYIKQVYADFQFPW